MKTQFIDKMVRELFIVIWNIMMVKHLIINHRGTYEWGSPKVPQTLAAIILHTLDDLSAKINIFRKVVEAYIGEKGDFSNFNEALGDTSNPPEDSGTTQGKFF